MHENPTKEFRVGEWHISPESNRARRNGESIKIEPRAMEVLTYLASRKGKVVSVDELLRAVWKENVTEASVYRVITRLRQALGDESDSGSYIETIPKRGYRLQAEVEFESERLGSEDKLRLVDRREPLSNRQRIGFFLAASVALIVLGALAFRGTSDESASADTDPGISTYTSAASDRRSIAVLPFENLSPDPNDAFIAAGIHDSLINELTKISALTVISRPSVLRYADGETPIQQIADELNVSAIVKGTVQYADDQIRIDTELIDPETGTNIWAETYDRDFSDYFGIQSDLAFQVASALEAQLLSHERESIARRPTESIAAFTAYLKGEYEIASGGSSSGRRSRTLAYIEEALAEDPEFALAHAFKAATLFDSRQFDPISEAERPAFYAEMDKLVFAHANIALSLDPDLGVGHAILGNLHITNWRIEAGLKELEQALETMPNFMYVLGSIGMAELYIRDRPEEAIKYARQIMELNPIPNGGLQLLGLALFRAGRYDEAIETQQLLRRRSARAFGSAEFQLARSEFARGEKQAALELLKLAEELRSNDQTPPPEAYAGFAHAYGVLGQSDDAKRAFEKFRDLVASQYVEPSIWARAYMGVGEYDEAREKLRELDEPLKEEHPYTANPIRFNYWNDPVLEQPEWVEVREHLALLPD